MNVRLRQFEIPVRRGFTLVELLVAMGIFVILATLSVAAFRGNQADRVGAAAATLKNALEGARNRAINTANTADPSPRGIRLIPDPSNGRIARSFVYLGGPTLYDGFLRLQFVPNNVAVDPYVGRWRAISEPIGNPGNAPFQLLFDGGVLAPGTRIEIPTNSGRWYTLRSFVGNQNTWELGDPAGDPANQDTWEQYHNRDVYLPLPGDDPDLVQSYHPMPYDPVYRVDPENDVYSDPDYSQLVTNVIVSTPLPFRIKLPPTILPGSQPTLLPEGVAIDLDGSDLPGLFHTLWRPDADNPYPDSNGNPNPDFYSPRMDVLFSPRGTLFGAQQSQGLVHFRIAYLSDIELDRDRGARPLFRSNSTRFVVPANPQKDHKAVSIYSETGQIVVSDINVQDLEPDGIADSPFSYAITGREAK